MITHPGSVFAEAKQEPEKATSEHVGGENSQGEMAAPTLNPASQPPAAKCSAATAQSDEEDCLHWFSSSEISDHRRGIDRLCGSIHHRNKFHHRRIPDAEF